MFWIIGIVAIVAIVVVWAISTNNSLVRLKTRVDEAFSTIDVYLKRRYDLIPNLVETVKGYASHEKDTLERVIAARNSAYSATSVEDRVDKENQFTQAIGRLFAVAEQYPDLKADSQFLNLSNQLEKVETDLAQSRKYYNGTVSSFNYKVQAFPSSIIAGMRNFTIMPFFEITQPEERENVKVQF